MYVIVHENFVVWGPKPWNKLGFEEILRSDCEIEFYLPIRNDAQEPIIINENTKILRVVDTEKPEINPKIQKLDGPFWTFYDDRAESSWTVGDQPIWLVKENLKAIVAANRYAKETGGIKVTIQGTEVSVDTSRDGRQIYFDTYLSLGDSETVGWKFNEMWANLTKQELGLIVLSGKNHIQSCFAWEATKVSEIDAATTLAELDAISLEYGE